MARPKVPLISRRKALAVALEIIDSDGLDALSIRRLATALGVNGASLYHHFSSKEDIVVGVVDLALAEVRGVGEPGASWRQWLPENARTLRHALLAHPALLPVVVAARSRGLGARLLDASAARLMGDGVPSAVVMPLLDALAAFAISSAMHETQRGGPDESAAEEYPALAKAAAERGLDADQIYDLVITSILQAIDTAVEQQRARWMPSAPVPVEGAR